MKRFLTIISIIVLSFFFSCKGGEDHLTVPSAIIPPDTLVFVLVDFHLVEAAVMEQQLKQEDPVRYAKTYYSVIFEKYGISRQRFDEAMVYYSSHPKLYRETYDKVLEELSRLQVESMR